MQKNISIIVAVVKDNVIGKNNQLIWHLPADLKRFKTLTMNHHILMGRKTFESIGKTLPGRISIIITSDKNMIFDGCIIAHSIEDAIKLAQDDNEIFIIGGDSIYRQSIELVNKLYITKIDADFDGDAFFPEMDFSKWILIESQSFQPDEKNQYPYQFLTYLKNI